MLTLLPPDAGGNPEPLLELAAQWRSLLEAGEDADDDELEALMAHQLVIEDRIAETPARTLIGLLVKARLTCWYAELDTVPLPLAKSLAADCARLLDG